MQLIVTDQASAALEDILNGSIYGMTEHGRKSFFNTFKNDVPLLLDNPLMGKQEPLLPEKYRSIVLHPLVKMIYSITEDTIYIHDFWNTLRSPDYLVSRIQ